jgi:hypothetical protein
MRSLASPSRPHALVDLYVPAGLGTPEALQARAAALGLDAIVLVAQDAFELPNPDSIAAVNETPGAPRVLVAPLVAGPGYRFVLLLPPAEVNLESIEAAGDPRVVVHAVAELGGLALPTCPRQGPGGDVARATPLLGDGRHGVIALTPPGSRLGRDLDLEDTAAGERPILGASGPFATLDDVGRYATLLPIDVRGDLATVSQRLLGALQRGLGFAVELQVKDGRDERRRPAVPDPHEGRADEAAPPKNKRRRRRRKQPQG